MANIIKINDFSAPELDVFVRLTGHELRAKVEYENGIFIAESPTVIEVALDSGCEPIALLTDERLINSSVEKIIERCEGIKIYSATKDVLEKLTGFALTRGALCAMKRPPMPTVEEILRGAKRVAVLEEITDSTNIGALFRSAAALNIDAVLVTPTCCDPLCRRAVRVSMGTVFLVPWTRIGEKHTDWPAMGLEKLKSLGFKTCAMALTDESVSIDDDRLMAEDKLAIILGTEGDGLSSEVISLSDYVVRIPMSHEVDSLNVAAASAVAFWELRQK
jgi:tRNA G18 (ribose-2'-O)-methylase SpoU